MAARQLSAKKPKHLRYTLRTFLSYLGRHKLRACRTGTLGFERLMARNTRKVAPHIGYSEP